MTYHFKIAGCSVELKQQWAVKIEFSEDVPSALRPFMMRGDGSFQERALHYTKDEALRAICERMGAILDEERGLEKGSGELLVMGAIREAFDEDG